MAAPTANSFLKTIPVTVHVGSAEAPSVVNDTTAAIERIYTDRVEDVATITVYYNGQLILPDTEPVLLTDSKFYYVVANTLDGSWPGLGPALPVTPDTSELKITIKCNAAYRGPGYDSGTSATAFVATDSMVVSYYYVEYTV